MTSFAQALSQSLLHFIWQGIAVGILLWIALLLLRRRSASARYAAACLALAVLAALPPITAWVVYAHAAAGPAIVPAAHVPVSAPAAPPPISHAAAGATDWVARAQSWALPLWSMGVLLFSIRLLWGARQVHRLRRRGSPAADDVLQSVAAIASRLGLGRAIQVLISSFADGPSVVGWIRPVILLPAATLAGLTPEQLEAVLAHELAHIRRHDYLVNLLQMVVETLLFYHPVVWWTSTRIRRERELCCDDLAVTSCGSALCYARALTVLERMRIATPEVAMGSTGSPLQYRILRLLGVHSEGRGSSRVAGAAALLLAALGLGLNAHWARGQERVSQQNAAPMRGYANFVMADPSQREAEHGVTVDTSGAQVLHRQAAEYPRAALEKGIQGTVVVETTLDAAGNVVDAHVVTGPTELRRAALESALTTHFVNQVAGSTRQISFTFTPAASQSEPQLSSGEPETSLEEAARIKRAMDAYQAADQQKQLAELTARMAQLDASMQQQGSTTGQAMLEAKRRLEETQAATESLREKLREAQENYRDDMPALAELKAELQTEQASVRKAEAELSSLQAAADQAENSDVIRQRVLELKAAREQMVAAETDAAKLKAEQGWAKRTPGLPGGVVAEITVYGLSDSLRDSLLAKLPVHQGDTLTADSFDQLKKAVQEFDEHLRISYSSSDAGRVSISISTPGAAGRVFVFGK